MKTCEVCMERPVHKPLTITKATGGRFTLECCAYCILFMLDIWPAVA